MADFQLFNKDYEINYITVSNISILLKVTIHSPTQTAQEKEKTRHQKR